MDEWIDQALSTYTDAEPRPGMEQRILARARASKTRFTPWLLAVAAVCLLCVGIVLWPKEQSPVPQVEAEMALPRVRSLVALLPLLPPRRRARHAPLPKRQTFPAMAPPPEPELQLARLSLENPQVAQALLAEPDTGEPKPIQIEPLSIKLLDED
jgi:hypothetical protein